MFVSTEGGDFDLVGAIILNCVEESLNFSAPLIKSIENTNSLAGTKDWEESGMAMEWTYHPDSGLNMAIRLAPEKMQ